MTATPRKSRTTKTRTKRHPSEIAPGVFVGGWNDALEFEGKRYCVLDELPSDAPADGGYTIYDEATEAPNVANLNRLAEAVRQARAGGSPVLIFCGHGVRRSPLAGAWYLHRSEGIDLDAAYDRIRAVRPKVEHAKEWIPHPDALDRA